MPLGSRQQRVLLTALLLRGGEVVSRDRLIDAIWGERAPPTAVKALQVHVSQLRKSLGNDAGPGGDQLVTRAPGYALAVEPDELDLQVFERLLDEGLGALRDGRPRVAREKLGTALDLWRGPPLGDLAFEDFARGEVERLDELRLAALEARIEADLALGAAGLVGELEALVASHPLRERLRGQLMLALYRDDRQADALAVYGEGRRALVDELGIEPSPTLRALHESILRQDPALGPAGEAPDEPAGEDDFVGREDEVRQLTGGLAAALDGRGTLFLIAGEPGAGKSRLAARMAAAAGRRGALVLSGRCWEAGGAPAYWPWVEALRSYVLATDRDALREHIGDGAPELVRIIPELRELVGGPTTAAGDSDSDRFRLFDAIGRFLRAAAEARPLVLVLEDMHAADASSLLLLEFLAARLEGARLLVLVTYRDTEVGPDDQLAATLPELEREAASSRIRLEGLAEDEIARFIEVTAGRAAAESATRLILAETAGNPLFVGETVRLLLAEDKLDAAGEATAWDFGVPDQLRDVVRRRLTRLSGATRELLSTAAVIGREFHLETMEVVSGLPRGALLDAVDEATASRVVEPVPGTRTFRRFSHAVIRDVLYDALPSAELRRLHTRVGRALETVYGPEAEAQSAELAHHFCRAAEAGGDVGVAVDWATSAGERGARLLAFEEARRLYELALETHGPAGDPATRCDLLLALGEVRSRGGDGPGAKQSFREAAGMARDTGMPDRLAHAALGYGGRFVWARSTTDPDLLPLLDAALESLGDREDALRARVLARLAAALRPGSSRPGADPAAAPSEAVVLGDRAVAIARALGEPATLAYALDGRVMADWTAGNAPERLAMAREIIALSEMAGDREQAFAGHDHALYCRWELGDADGVAAELAELSRAAEDMRQPAQLWELACAQGMLATSQGRFAEGAALAARALDLGREAQAWNAPLSYALQLFTLRGAQGRLAEVRHGMEAAVREYPTYAALRCALGRLYATVGEDGLARDTVAGLAADDFAAVARDEDWSLGLSLLAETCAALGEKSRARVLHDLLLPHAELVAVGAPDTCGDAVAGALGLLAETIGEPELAIEHFGRAMDLNQRMGARPSLAHAQADCARVLRRRGRSGDGERADELLAAAGRTYRELGMKSFAAAAAGRHDDPA